MSKPLISALYPGIVSHHRLRPREHRLAYRIWSMLIDLDELDELDRRLKLFSVGRFNLFAFYPRDRGDKSGVDLKRQVEAAMRAAGLAADGGPIRLFTMPRFMGWGFNPLSVFFCHRRDGSLAAILWEVDNTFGERHGYLIPVESEGEDEDGGEIRQSCAKAFYVSPFMDMNLRYDFAVVPPAALFRLAITVSDGDGMLLTARHNARRVEVSDAALLRLFLTIPLLTLRVVGGIHWEALKLWLKGLRLRTRPAPPPTPVSFVRPAHETRKVLS